MARSNTGHAFAERMKRARAAAAAKRAGHHKPKAKRRHEALNDRCDHCKAIPIIQGRQLKWCRECGAVYAKAKWHLPSSRR